MRQGDLDDLAPGVAQPGDTLLPERVDFGGHAVDPVLLGHADPEALDRLSDEGREVRDLGVQAGGVLRVMPGHGLQEDGRVLYRPGDRSGLVERGGEGDHAPAGTTSVGGLDPHCAREGRRLADRAAGVGGGRPKAEARRDGGRGAARGPAGRKGRIVALTSPGADHRPEGRGLVGRAHGELIQVQLAQHDRAVAPELGGHGGLIGRREGAQDPAAGGGSHALGAEQVLDPKRNSIKRAGLG